MIDPADFDLNRFLNPKPMVTLFPGFKYIENVLHHVMMQKQIVALVSDIGTGVDIIFKNFEGAFKGQVFLIDCKSHKRESILPDIMIRLGFGHQLVNWHEADYPNIVKALSYYFHEINKRMLFIFNDFDNVSKTLALDYIQLAKDLKGTSGFIIRYTPEGAIKFSESSDPRKRRFITESDDWAELNHMTPEELNDFCYKSGVLSPHVVKQLTEDYPLFEVLYKRLEKTREQLSPST